MANDEQLQRLLDAPLQQLTSEQRLAAAARIGRIAKANHAGAEQTATVLLMLGLNAEPTIAETLTRHGFDHNGAKRATDDAGRAASVAS